MGDCKFCAIAAGEPAADAHVVYSDPDVVAFLDHRPVFKGHTLVIPRQHVVTLPELPDALLVAATEAWLEQAARLARTRRAVALITDALRGRIFVPRI